MAKKKNITENDIISWYMDDVLNHNKQPSSVYSFAKENNFEEALFYKHFGSFDAIEKGVFKAFFNNTITLLEKSEDYGSFDARNKLLTCSQKGLDMPEKRSWNARTKPLKCSYKALKAFANNSKQMLAKAYKRPVKRLAGSF